MLAERLKSLFCLLKFLLVVRDSLLLSFIELFCDLVDLFESVKNGCVLSLALNREVWVPKVVECVLEELSSACVHPAIEDVSVLPAGSLVLLNDAQDPLLDLLEARLRLGLFVVGVWVVRLHHVVFDRLHIENSAVDDSFQVTSEG